MVEDDSSILIGKRIDFWIKVDYAEGLPKEYCKDTYVQYKFYHDQDNFGTEICEGVNPNPKWNYSYHYTADYVSEDMLQYMIKDALCFRVYGSPSKGTGQAALIESEKGEKRDIEKQITKKHDLRKSEGMDVD